MPLWASWNRPLVCAHAPGASASFVAEEFALQQGLGNRGAVQGNERPLPSRVLVVNGAGDDFFARARLTLNQCHGITIRDHTNQV